MSFKKNWEAIWEAVAERKEVKSTIKKIKHLTKNESEDEFNSNTLTNELMSVYFNAKNSFNKQNIEIVGMVGHPNLSLVRNKKQIGSRDDPRIYLSTLDKHVEFNQRFTLEEHLSPDGQEQYIIKEKLI